MLHGSLRATNDATGEPLHAASEVANNKTKQLTVMEAQGRGYAHDHEKIASIIEAMGVDQLCALLDSSLSEPEHSASSTSGVAEHAKRQRSQ